MHARSEWWYPRMNFQQKVQQLPEDLTNLQAAF